MELILVAFGGAIGSILRYAVSKRIAGVSNFVLAIFLVNITGAILLGVVTGLRLQGNLLIFFADGILGAFTTFSTFMYEGFNLYENKKILNAVIYIFGSLLIGILGYFIGLNMANFLGN